MKVLFLLLLINTFLLSFDVSDKIEILDSPYKAVYPNKKDLYAGNIWDMREFDGKLYMGAGNSSNIGPKQNAGPVLLISYNPLNKEFKTEAIVDDEQIDIIDVFENKLYIPGHDATQNWEYANIYIKNNNEELKKYRNIKNGLHVYDVAFYNGKIFTALGVKEGAAVGISSNNANSWDIQNLNHFRIYSFLKVANSLFAIKFFPSSEDLKKMSKNKKKQFFSVAEYKADVFVPNYDLNSKNFFPDSDNLDYKSQKIVHSVNIDKKTIYIGAYLHNDHQFIPFGVYYTEFINDTLVSKKIKIQGDYQVWDILYKNGKTYLLAYNKNTKVVKVFFAIGNNFDSFSEYISFKSSTFARSFELIGDKFYFSLGSEVSDPKNFDYDEISEDTGKILILNTKDITN
ncbi:MAG: hypothetical protein A2513_08810 [Sulfurimonas sp. RIFOXYD12_FULL_33_39]|uniref:hypothetical protein n=1 Tax=unclassified Sulfurimonas TaxID=2623549 RepID=UPI0008AD0866|nr:MULTISPECIES: hypothetical protein [unclassified Sulfurimonas]OHE01027.1 MAG: hypothetical protein A3G74_03895 [Sulfurimonas sp. RIFCSPLOWO2_12_FULL_34_6]OHE10184.1 MAG: hypothetical protein A2513_08810 [Sulfurimonas sp. RIFOXYD12_FULL_33_39]OHE14595.1 MAG: hypothetical protein A2530_01670 [Sulfurimonas sp. RIFOXYD2_FULL_34_21]DAB28308.1 MAG TPA: hypothetical protein CFH78_03165 [Sulfurimonas sp. UBA10385]